MISDNHNAPVSTLDFIDAASGKLEQAQAVLALLTFAGHEVPEGITRLPYKTVMDNLWTVQDILDQAQEAVRGFDQCLRVTKETAQ